jgi:sugar phosphate isomerase/epimerase
VIVAASTYCFRRLPFSEALGRLADLEYSNVEIVIDEDGCQLKPSEVARDLDYAISLCRDTHRLDVVAYEAEIKAIGQEYLDQFTAICRLAKATKVVTITVPSAELGTPFNEEVEKLRRLVAIATLEGARVSIRSQRGRLSEDPDTVMVLCDNVDGLGLTLDPSHYLGGPHGNKGIDKLLKYVYHVHLRDSTKEKLQVRVGQGVIEYGRLVSQLNKSKYQRALSVRMDELPGVDHSAEMRKMRLLLESLL